MIFWEPKDKALCGRGPGVVFAATAAGICRFWSAPLGGFTSAGGLLWRDAASPGGGLFTSVDAPRIVFRI